MKKVFILNLGTTSLKFKLYASDGREKTLLAAGEMESVGTGNSACTLRYADGRSFAFAQPIADHAQAFSVCLARLEQDGILSSMAEVDAVGYKAVHGGSLSGTCVVDDALLTEMARVSSMAPAHNPIYLRAMKAIREQFPNLSQFARFETSFHGTIPPYRRVYGVPFAWAEELGVKKYGFHGSSHEFISRQLPKGRVISCHLGGSSSLCAIRDGRSIATTMGATPQSGLFQNNRVGDFDVFCLPLLMEKLDLDLTGVLQKLSAESGLLGLSGVSNDLRLVIAAAKQGNSQAQLALDAFADNIVGYIGMFTAYLGGLDTLVFTGGIGLNSGDIRKAVCEKLGYLGLRLDEGENRANREVISAKDSAVTVRRIKTDEESVVADSIFSLLSGD